MLLDRLGLIRTACENFLSNLTDFCGFLVPTCFATRTGLDCFNNRAACCPKVRLATSFFPVIYHAMGRLGSGLARTVRNTRVNRATLFYHESSYSERFIFSAVVLKRNCKVIRYTHTPEWRRQRFRSIWGESIQR